jgi:hypothetical protein
MSGAELGKMDFRGAKEALEALDKLDDARTAFRRNAKSVSDQHHGPQGVSSAVRFVDDATALFDAHVAHLVERHKTALRIAIFKDENQ